ncbi:hypothetical protein B0H15DRAFT_808526 [Mycena belliarum]|uniref:Uncharacterized protein n=1 Tax=Mycena belliarum TaxID=1033014 RepID=A0AAD6UQ64_9AGAR|nr:hypothetical protein B0H15DRAFT_808526 [Mycena belliae]
MFGRLQRGGQFAAVCLNLRLSSALAHERCLLSKFAAGNLKRRSRHTKMASASGPQTPRSDSAPTRRRTLHHKHPVVP